MYETNANQTYFSKRVKAVRESLGLSILDISKRSGISRNSVYNYESGKTIPTSVEIWNLLAQAHDMSLESYMDALFGQKNIQPELKRLEEKVVRLEELMKKCPLGVDSS